MEINTQSPAVPTAIVFAILTFFSQPSFTQVYVEADQLLRVIEDQQRQLEEQEAQIQRQKAALDTLRQQVEELRRAIPEDPSLPPRLKDHHPEISPSELESAIAEAPTDWPGSIQVTGRGTRIKISGFAELDANYDTGAIVSPAEFITSAIVTSDRTAAEGEDGQTNVSVQVSRLKFETRTPWGGRKISTEMTMDFLRDFSVAEPILQLRKAYGRVSDIFLGGSLLLGQDWSTFTNLNSWPNTLDYEGPNSLPSLRHPIVRWERVYHPTLTLEVALEAPDERVFEGAVEVSRWPDAVVAVISQTDHINFQGSFILRDLRGSGEPQSTVSDTGWGVNLSGAIDLPGRLAPDFISYSVSYGAGYGGILNDFPADASYDFYENRLEAIPTLAWYIGYQHWWTPCLYTAATYGLVQQDNFDFQPGFAFRETQYSSINLTWTPTPQWLFGVEALYGTREDKDGAYGSVWRTQFTSRISF